MQPTTQPEVPSPFCLGAPACAWMTQTPVLDQAAFKGGMGMMPGYGQAYARGGGFLQPAGRRRDGVWDGVLDKPHLLTVISHQAQRPRTGVIHPGLAADNRAPAEPGPIALLRG